MGRVLIVVVAAALLGGLAASSSAPAATPKPDAHDRALARQLAAKVTSLKKLASATNADDDRLTNALKGCKALGNQPADSIAVFFAMLPVLLVDIVNEIRPLLVEVRNTIAPMRPHAAVLRTWLGAQKVGLDQMLSFDNHGRKIDYCAAAKVMLAKNPSDAAIGAVLGVDPATIKSVVTGGTQGSKTVQRLNPQVRSFLIAAGVRRIVAVQLTQ